MQSDDVERVSGYRSSGSADDTTNSRIALIVPRTLVKRVKDALEAHRILDKDVKIRPARLEEQKASLQGASVDLRPGTLFIPTKLSVSKEQVDLDTLPVEWDLHQQLGLIGCETDIGIIAFEQAQNTYGFLGSERGCQDDPSPHQASASESSYMNHFARTVGHWLHQLPHEKLERTFARDVVLSCSWTYMIYPPLLLLPPTALSNLSCIFTSNGEDILKDLSSLWCLLSTEFRASHIALNAPILASTSKKASVQKGEHLKANILRSPTGLAPLYGDFGPNLPLDHIPTITDFSSAFWCTAQQNGIFQTWAPRYTMFSRGNISEKARILNLKTLTEEQLGSRPEETSAVDLYAGIGYFTFSYIKVGVGKVLCWEINPWSVEGLKRGAKRNRWGAEVIKDGPASNETINREERLLVFQESNQHAAKRIAAMKESIPPVRHVNCGLLPSSKDSWGVAVQVLHPIGGWIHVHENIAKRDIESRTEEIVGIFVRLVRKHCMNKAEEQWGVECEHVQQVKSYAPGVMHYVLDIFISSPG